VKLVDGGAERYGRPRSGDCTLEVIPARPVMREPDGLEGQGHIFVHGAGGATAEQLRAL
jgi:hypothetical protein